MRLIFDNTKSAFPVPAWMERLSGQMLKEAFDARPKTESARKAMAAQLNREGFTEAAKYWQEQ